MAKIYKSFEIPKFESNNLNLKRLNIFYIKLLAIELILYIILYFNRIYSNLLIKYRIIFRSNIDGDCASTFHEKCDKIRNTLILIKASGNKRFGGFTTETWDGNDINKKDEKSFIFSIDKMKIYDIIPGQNAINCNPDLGPVFLSQIKLLDKFFTQGGTTGTKWKNYKTLEDFEITDGAEKFGVKEVEVYQTK